VGTYTGSTAKQIWSAPATGGSKLPQGKKRFTPRLIPTVVQKMDIFLDCKLDILYGKFIAIDNLVFLQ